MASQYEYELQQEMLEYFDKFKNQEPYLHINETEWSYIKETFEKDDVKESLRKGRYDLSNAYDGNDRRGLS